MRKAAETKLWSQKVCPVTAVAGAKSNRGRRLVISTSSEGGVRLRFSPGAIGRSRGRAEGGVPSNMSRAREASKRWKSESCNHTLVRWWILRTVSLASSRSWTDVVERAMEQPLRVFDGSDGRSFLISRTINGQLPPFPDVGDEVSQPSPPTIETNATCQVAGTRT